MKRQIILLFLLFLVAMTGCSEGSQSSAGADKNYMTTKKEITTTTVSSRNASINESTSAFTHYCDASGCIKKGNNEWTGISGEKEYYCDEHYNEMLGLFDQFESDVGAGEYSKHKCEECDKEGTHSIIGVTGQTEYYCTEHYEQLLDMLEMFEVE